MSVSSCQAYLCNLSLVHADTGFLPGIGETIQTFFSPSCSKLHALLLCTMQTARWLWSTQHTILWSTCIQCSSRDPKLWGRLRQRVWRVWWGSCSCVWGSVNTQLWPGADQAHQ